MHELKRRAYLEAMGVATYISRVNLAGAAPSRKLVVVRPSGLQRESIASSMPVGVGSDTGAKSAPVRIPRIDLASATNDTGPAAVTRQTTTSAAELVPAGKFSIVAMLAGNRLWLEELPEQRALLREQGQLVQAIAHALGWGDGKPEISQFNWPIHTNSQLDLGEEAARASLGGFISRKLQASGCRGIVLLGEGGQKWVPQEQFGEWQSVATVSTLDMLRSPELKKQAWRDLLPHAEGG